MELLDKPGPWLEFTLHALATYRLALMVTKEAGPGWIFKKLRGSVKRKAPKTTHMDDGISCIFCMSMQLGILVAGLRALFAGHWIYDTAIFALAISAVAVAMNQAFTKGELK